MTSNKLENLLHLVGWFSWNCGGWAWKSNFLSIYIFLLQNSVYLSERICCRLQYVAVFFAQ